MASTTAGARYAAGQGTGKCNVRSPMARKRILKNRDQTADNVEQEKRVRADPSVADGPNRWTRDLDALLERPIPLHVRRRVPL